jgi:2-hydroxychromene-2-carboxylate isomerase
MSPPVFYYDTNSPYAYLAAARIDEVLPDAEWHPIALGIVLRELGRVPWSLGPERAEGMVEIERRAVECGLPPVRWAEGWPVDTYSLAPLRALEFADEQGAQRELARALYRRMFEHGASLAEVDNVLRAAGEAGLDPQEVRTALGDDRIKERLREHTDAALALGVIGVPTVVVNGAVFWGDDRLEDAAAAAGPS